MRPGTLNVFFASLTSLKGVGEKIANKLADKIGPYPRDLLFHLPTGLEVRHAVEILAPDLVGQKVTLTVTPHTMKSMPKRHIIQCEAGGVALEIAYFNMQERFIKNIFSIGKPCLVSGTLGVFQGTYQMVHPDFVGSLDKRDIWVGVQPIYSKVGGIGQRNYRRVVDDILSRLPVLPEWIAEAYMEAQHFPTFLESLVRVHHPTALDDIMLPTSAHRRLAFDELCAFQLARKLSTALSEKETAASLMGDTVRMQAFIQHLPFSRTQDQLEVCNKIEARLKSTAPLQALLLGDVGTGKTLVALFALVQAVLSGKQGALLAPTEILAQQHFATFQALLKDMNIEVALLTGSTPMKVRRGLLENLKWGKIHILVGTHALLEPAVCFQDLACVVIDEQHRFGVAQRMRLLQKGKAPHLILMSATPIPRTLLMGLYGDMEVFTLREKPRNNAVIETSLVPSKKMDALIAGVGRKLAAGEKVYWVCPLVEESEAGDEGDGRAPKTDVETRFQALTKDMPGEKIFMLHGRLSSEEKTRIMDEYRACPAGVLVATTVIEVGVDVPEATAIIIENAHNFGLAQLHQLRGRVGRGARPGQCVLLYDAGISETGKKRLDTLKTTHDGFKIAEVDLEMRGGGDLFGTKQSGLPAFFFADLFQHQDLVKESGRQMQQLLKEDPGLKGSMGERMRLVLHLFSYDCGALIV